MNKLVEVVLREEQNIWNFQAHKARSGEASVSALAIYKAFEASNNEPIIIRGNKGRDFKLVKYYK
jgi:hypothetical protein